MIVLRLGSLISACALALLPGPCAMAQQAAVNAGEAEAQKCEERIASVQREVLGRYEASLGEMQAALQKAADLDGALAIRAERQRVAREGTLTEKHFVTEPKALRTLQEQTSAKIQELSSHLVQETLPKLVEHKKALTIAGRLDEAVAVRAAIERLQSGHVPLVRVEPGAVVAAESLLQAYAADRARADKTYKGQRFVVRGVVGGFRADPADARGFQVFLAGSAAATGAWVHCSLPPGEFRFREERLPSATFLGILPKDNENTVVRIQRGQTVEIRGTCEGWEDSGVRLAKCDSVK
jgi:hypothetical protein